MDSASPFQDISHVIQLSIAPVFLLTAIGTLLGVLSTRLARIVDRARVLHERLATRPEARVAIAGQLHLLRQRRHLVNTAITFGVSAALLVCLLIATAFLGSIFKVRLGVLIAVLFIFAMVGLVGVLVSFLREILLAVGNVEIEVPRDHS